MHRLLRKGKFVGFIHRPADIEQQHQVDIRLLPDRQFVTLDADVNQLLAFAPRGVTDRHGGLERLVA